MPRYQAVGRPAGLNVEGLDPRVYTNPWVWYTRIGASNTYLSWTRPNPPVGSIGPVAEDYVLVVCEDVHDWRELDFWVEQWELSLHLDVERSRRNGGRHPSGAPW